MPKPLQPAITDEVLLAAARAAAANAYAPYSGLCVGAALAASDGRIFSGCNVENASYGLTVCAERNAVARAVAEGARSFRSIVVVSSRRAALMPCGACRQTLHEFGPRLRVLCVGAGGGRLEFELADLLPHAFDGESLEEGGPGGGGAQP